MPALLLVATTGTKDLSGIHWLKDDWNLARKRALRDNKLIAVDTEARWCHTCLSMKTYVFTRPELSKVSGAYVWLRLDYDNPKNAPFFERYSTNIIPTYYLIDPEDGKVVGRRMGAGSVEDMLAFYSQPRGRALARAEQALANQRYGQARRIYARALERASKGVARTRMLSGYTEALWKSDPKACAREGAKRLESYDNTVQGLDTVMIVASCASQLTDEKERHRIMARVANRLASAVADPSLPLLPDDRSSYYIILVGIYDLLGRTDEATAALKKQIALLERAAREAASPLQRSTYEWHRVLCYLRLGRYADAEKMLLRSERDEPKDFNHSWRLALVYAKQGKIEPGLRAVERGFVHAYGGRKIRLYGTKIDLLVQKGDLDAARRVEREARRHIAQTSPSQIQSSWLEDFEAIVAKLRAAPRGR